MSCALKPPRELQQHRDEDGKIQLCETKLRATGHTGSQHKLSTMEKKKREREINNAESHLGC